MLKKKPFNSIWKHLQHEILTLDIAFQILFQIFSWLKFGVYTLILKKLSLNLVILFTGD